MRGGVGVWFDEMDGTIDYDARADGNPVDHVGRALQAVRETVGALDTEMK